MLKPTQIKYHFNPYITLGDTWSALSCKLQICVVWTIVDAPAPRRFLQSTARTRTRTRCPAPALCRHIKPPAVLWSSQRCFDHHSGALIVTDRTDYPATCCSSPPNPMSSCPAPAHIIPSGPGRDREAGVPGEWSLQCGSRGRWEPLCSGWRRSGPHSALSIVLMQW